MNVCSHCMLLSALTYALSPTHLDHTSNTLHMTQWVAAMNHWSKFYVTVPVLLFVGIKLNAIYFYHFMEFTSHTPPQNLIPYFSAEGPYIVSMFVVIYQTMDALASQRGRLAAAEQIIRESFTTKLTEKKKK